MTTHSLSLSLFSNAEQDNNEEERESAAAAVERSLGYHDLLIAAVAVSSMCISYSLDARVCQTKLAFTLAFPVLFPSSSAAARSLIATSRSVAVGSACGTLLISAYDGGGGGGGHPSDLKWPVCSACPFWVVYVSTVVVGPFWGDCECTSIADIRLTD